MGPAGWVTSEGTTRPAPAAPPGRERGRDGSGAGERPGQRPRSEARRDRRVTRGEALFGRQRKHPGGRACALRPIRALGRCGGPGTRSRGWPSAGLSGRTGGTAGAPGGAGGLRDPLYVRTLIASSSLARAAAATANSHPRSRGPRLPSRRWMLWGSVPERGRGARCGGAMGPGSGRARSPLPR